MILRVFPRRTKATPTDPAAFVGDPPLLAIPADASAVHVSVAFTWDLPEAERLVREWERTGLPVKIGGPATGQRGEDFTPGMYLRPGYTITSRGCPNRCWFCDVWKRDGPISELPISDGWNVQDDNLLACSETHIRAVFGMLLRQKAMGHQVEFAGGLEAARLMPWHVELLSEVKPRQMFFAYDEPKDLEPLTVAVDMLHKSGWSLSGKRIRCFVLCGYPTDTIESAQSRMEQVLALGAVPCAMLWRDNRGYREPAWRTFQRRWSRPAMIKMQQEQT